MPHDTMKSQPRVLDVLNGLKTGVMYRVIEPSVSGKLPVGATFTLERGEHQDFVTKNIVLKFVLIVFNTDARGNSHNIMHRFGSTEYLGKAIHGAVVAPNVEWARDRILEHQEAIRELRELYPGVQDTDMGG